MTGKSISQYTVLLAMIGHHNVLSLAYYVLLLLKSICTLYTYMVYYEAGEFCIMHHEHSIAAGSRDSMDTADRLLSSF